MDSTEDLKKEIIRIEGIIEDQMIEQKKIDLELKNSREQLNLILKNSTNVYYNYVFEDATWGFISDSMVQAIGVSSEDYILGGVEKAVTYLHPDDTIILENHLQHMLDNQLEKITIHILNTA